MSDRFLWDPDDLVVLEQLPDPPDFPVPLAFGFDPHQPRDPGGEHGGQWIPAGWPSLDELKDMGSAGGTTGPRFAEDAQGRRYVVKTGEGGAAYASPSVEHLRSEMAADGLYRAMGVRVPDSREYTAADGKPVKVARFVKGTELGRMAPDDPRRLELTRQLKKGFAVDAWLGAWDVIGAGPEAPQANVLLGEDGKAYRLDSGGSLFYKGMGELKPHGAFGPEVAEIDRLRQSSSGAPVFGALTDAEVAAQIREQLTPERVHQALEQLRDRQVAEMLAARAEWMRAWADQHLAHESAHESAQTFGASMWKPEDHPRDGEGRFRVKLAGSVYNLLKGLVDDPNVPTSDKLNKAINVASVKGDVNKSAVTYVSAAGAAHLLGTVNAALKQKGLTGAEKQGLERAQIEASHVDLAAQHHGLANPTTVPELAEVQRKKLDPVLAGNPAHLHAPKPPAPKPAWPPAKGAKVIHPKLGQATVLGPGPKGDPNYLNVQQDGKPGHSYWKLSKLKPADGTEPPAPKTSPFAGAPLGGWVTDQLGHGPAKVLAHEYSADKPWVKVKLVDGTERLWPAEGLQSAKAPPSDPFAGILTGQKLNAAIAQWQQGITLTSGEREAVNSYTGSGYRNINQAARGKGVSNPNTERTIQHLDNALEKGVVEREVVVHRGVKGNTGALWKSVKEGQYVRDLGYGSTSADPTIASGWAAAGKGAIVHIRLPKGAHALWVSDHGGSQGDQESEVLLPRGMKFKVVKRVQKGTGRIDIWLEAIRDIHPFGTFARDEHWREQPRDPGGEHGGQWVEGPGGRGPAMRDRKGRAFDPEAPVRTREGIVPSRYARAQYKGGQLDDIVSSPEALGGLKAKASPLDYVGYRVYIGDKTEGKRGNITWAYRAEDGTDMVVVDHGDGTASTLKHSDVALLHGRRNEKLRKAAAERAGEPVEPEPPPPKPEKVKPPKGTLAELIDRARTGELADGEMLSMVEHDKAIRDLGRSILADAEAEIAKAPAADLKQMRERVRAAKYAFEAQGWAPQGTPDRAKRDRLFRRWMDEQKALHQMAGGGGAAKARGRALKAALERAGVTFAKPEDLKLGTKKGASVPALRAAMEFVPAEWVEASNRDRRELKVQKTTGRAYHSVRPDDRLIKVRPGDVSTALHEFGHTMEHVDPKIRMLEEIHRDVRVANTADPAKKKQRRLKDIYPGSGYRSDETAYEDEFANAYTGKVYGPANYEVLTMGLQLAFFGDGRKSDASKGGHVSSGSPLTGAWADDPELVAWTVGVVASQRRDFAAEDAQKVKDQKAGQAWLDKHADRRAELAKVADRLDLQAKKLTYPPDVRERTEKARLIRHRLSDAAIAARAGDLEKAKHDLIAAEKGADHARDYLEPEKVASELRERIAVHLAEIDKTTGELNRVPEGWADAINAWAAGEKNPEKMRRALSSGIVAYRTHHDRNALANVLQKQGVDVVAPYQVASIAVLKKQIGAYQGVVAMRAGNPKLDAWLTNLEGSKDSPTKMRQLEHVLVTLQKYNVDAAMPQTLINVLDQQFPAGRPDEPAYKDAGRTQFQKDKLAGLGGEHLDPGVQKLSTPQAAAAEAFGNPEIYDLLQATRRDPGALPDMLHERFDGKPSGWMFRSDGSEYTIHGDRLEEAAVEIERHALWLEDAIDAHGEIPPPLSRVTGMGHFPPDLLARLKAGDTVTVAEPGFLAASASEDTAMDIGDQTAHGEQALWRIDPDGWPALHTSEHTMATHGIDEWVFAPNTRMEIRLEDAGNVSEGDPPIYKVRIIV